MEDISSKFGTLVLVRRPLLLDCGTRICLQAGRTLLDVIAKKKRNWLSCFSACRHKPPVQETLKRVVTEESNM